MDDAELVDAGEDAAGAAQFEIGAPNFGPAAFDRDATRDGLGCKAVRARFGAKGAFQAGNGDKKDFELARPGSSDLSVDSLQGDEFSVVGEKIHAATGDDGGDVRAGADLLLSEDFAGDRVDGGEEALR